jgi:hypothetical protein
MSLEGAIRRVVERQYRFLLGREPRPLLALRRLMAVSTAERLGAASPGVSHRN